MNLINRICQCRKVVITAGTLSTLVLSGKPAYANFVELGAGGSTFSFRTIAGGSPTCTMDPATSFGYPIAGYFCTGPVGLDCIYVDAYTVVFASESGGPITLQANHTYSISQSTVNAMNANYHNTSGRYPNNLYLNQFFCTLGQTSTNAIISFPGWSANCDASGCIASSPQITVTFP